MDTVRRIASALIASAREESFEAAVYAACSLVFFHWKNTESNDKTSLGDDDPLRRLSAPAIARMRTAVNDQLNDADQDQHFQVFEELLLLRQTRLSGSGLRQGPNALVASIMAELSGNPQTVLDPACGIGTTLLAVGSRYPHSKLVGVEEDPEASGLARKRLELAGLNAQVHTGAWTAEKDDDKYDAILVTPPLGMGELFGGDREVRGAEIRWVGRVSASLSPKGRACVLLPTRSTFRSGKLGNLRDRILKSGRVRSIVELPSKSVLDASTSTCLWVISGEAAVADKPILLVNLKPIASGRAEGWDKTGDAIEQLKLWLDDHEEPVSPKWLSDLKTVNQLLLSNSALPSVLLERRSSDLDAFISPPEMISLHSSHLVELRMQNFKGVGSLVTIPLRSLTLILGKNSAGKSSILQSLLLLRQSIDEPNLNPYGPDTRLGSYSGIIHKHDASKHLRLGVTFSPPSGVNSASIPSQLRKVDLEFFLDDDGNAKPTSVSGMFVDHQLTWQVSPVTGKFQLPVAQFQELARVEEELRRAASGLEVESIYRQLMDVLQKAGFKAVDFTKRGLLPAKIKATDLELIADRGNQLPMWSGSLASALEKTGVIVDKIGKELAELLSKIAYLGPLREAPTRLSQRSSSLASPNIPFLLLHNVALRRLVSRHLKDLKMPYRLDAVPVVTPSGDSFVGELAGLVLTDQRTGVRLSPSDVGFGVSQVLPIIVQLAACRDSVIMIEQPEIHLHPGMQAELADLLIEATDPAGRANQVIAETHSESMVLRLQRRIKDGTLDQGDVAIIYVDQDRSGECIVKELRIDENGDFIDEWPHGFFEEQFNELFGDM